MLFVWVTLTFLGATLEQQTNFENPDYSGQGTTSTLSYLTNLKNVMFDQSSTGTWSFVMINTKYFSTLIKCATWDFSFMQTDIGNMVRWMIFVPFTIAFLAMLAFEFITLVQGFIPWT